MNNLIISIESIEKKIHVIRGYKVMLDTDLAKLYDIETYRLNEAVKRNIERFPENFMFQLTKGEWEDLTSQIAISKSGRGGRRTLPYVFTEHGVLMSANVLNSSKAINVSIQIVNAFVKLRQIAIDYKDMPQRLSEIEKLLMLYIEKNDEKVSDIIHVLNNLIETPRETGKLGFRTEE